jgi:hypothetical protein
MVIAQPKVSYADIQAILDQAVGSDAVGAHGPFWRNLERDAFVAHRVFGKPLVVIGVSAESNLVKALRAIAPFGKDVGTPGATTRRMPAGLPAIAEPDLIRIENWIDAGCPA